MEVLTNVTALACLMSLANYAPLPEGENAGSAMLRQVENVHFDIEVSTPSQASTETTSRPGLERLMSMESSLNDLLYSEESARQGTKGTPLRYYQSANYKQSQPIRSRPRNDGKCLVYKIYPCHGESCRESHKTLEFAEVWLSSSDFQSLAHGESGETLLNVSVDVFHRNPFKHRSSVHQYLGQMDINVKAEVLVREAWLFINLQRALPLVNCVFRHAKPIFIRMCSQNSSVAPEDAGGLRRVPKTSTTPFLIKGYSQERQSLLDFIKSSNIDVTMTEDQRSKRNVPTTAEVTSRPITSDTLTPESETTTQPQVHLEAVNRTCGRVPFTLNMSNLDSTKVFLAPLGGLLNLWYCAGECTNESETNSNFAAIRRLARDTSSIPNTQFKECCVPKKISEDRITFAWQDRETGANFIRKLPSHKVEECGCT